MKKANKILFGILMIGMGMLLTNCEEDTRFTIEQISKLFFIIPMKIMLQDTSSTGGVLIKKESYGTWKHLFIGTPKLTTL
jgi:hypothetical protein